MDVKVDTHVSLTRMLSTLDLTMELNKSSAAEVELVLVVLHMINS